MTFPQYAGIAVVVGVIVIAVVTHLASSPKPGRHRAGTAPGTEAQRIAAGALVWVPVRDRDTERIDPAAAARARLAQARAAEVPLWATGTVAELPHVDPQPMVDPALKAAA